MDTVIAIPGYLNHCNLAVFPASPKQDSHVYLLGTSCFAPVELDQKIQVEYLEGHIYCLLPSYQPTLGTVCYHTECPQFITDFSFGIDIGAVAPQASHSDSATKVGKRPREKDVKNLKECELKHKEEKQGKEKHGDEKKEKQGEYEQDEVKYGEEEQKEMKQKDEKQKEGSPIMRFNQKRSKNKRIKKRCMKKRSRKKQSREKKNIEKRSKERKSVKPNICLRSFSSKLKK